MPSYRRIHCPGGTFFFTLVTEARAPILCTELARPLLHAAIAQCARVRPFTLKAIVLLPDHLHLLMSLPPDDADYSTRLASIKAAFTHAYLAAGGVEQPRSNARLRKRRRGVWQRWFWEHRIRDQADCNNHLNYIHYNPVHHNHVPCPHAWAYSSFERHVQQGVYRTDWLCQCNGNASDLPFDAAAFASSEPSDP
jgi:putative transposase